MTSILDEIPEELEFDVEEYCLEYSNLTHLLMCAMASMSDSGIVDLLRRCPVLIAAIDNPSVRMKRVIDDKYLSYANNLDPADIILIASNYPDRLDMMTHENLEVAKKTITVDIALTIFKDDDITLRQYSDCEWYKQALELKKLGDL